MPRWPVAALPGPYCLHYDAAVYVMGHFTRFAKTGWENDTNTAGIWRTVPEASFSGVSGTENLDGSNGAASYLEVTMEDTTETCVRAVHGQALRGADTEPLSAAVL